MKRLVVFAAMMFFPLALMAQIDFKFTQDGAFATFSQFTPPFTSVSLQVSSGTNNGVAAVSLQYSLVSEPADFSSLTITNVFGPIPAGAFNAQNTQQISLNIDTSTLNPATFFSETCVITFATGVETCGAGPAGLIQLTFQENDLQSTQVNLHQVQISGPVTTRTHKSSDESTASVQGTAFGTQITSASASVGINHMSTIEVTHP